MVYQSRQTFLLILICAYLCLPINAQDVNDLNEDIRKIFGPPPTTPSTEECNCVLYYLCDNGVINTDGHTLIDVRSSVCGEPLEICCSLQKNSTTTSSTPVPVTKTNEPKCGKRNVDGTGFKLINSVDEAEYTEFPWMAAVLVEKGSWQNLEYKCGGAIIHPKFILTAAHCVNNKKDKFVIRAGEWDAQRTTEQYINQDFPVEKVTIHPDFYSGALHNDIAILKLEDELVMAPNVGLICLPEEDDLPIEGSYCTVTGWGQDVFGKKGVFQAILKKVDLPIVGKNACQKSLQRTRLGQRFKLDESFICAGGEKGKDTCKGDGGSPLVCRSDKNPNIYQLTGLVSWGVGCGQEDIPALYVNVPMYRKWIDQQLRT